MNKETTRAIGAGGGDYSMEQPVELRMADGSYQTIDPNQPVVDVSAPIPKKKSAPEETVYKVESDPIDKPKAIKFSLTPQWTMDFVRGRVHNVRGIYASTTIAEGGGWQLSYGDGHTYIVSVVDWNSCIDIVADKLHDMKTESSQLMFSEHDLEDDPVLGPLIALVT